MKKAIVTGLMFALLLFGAVFAHAADCTRADGLSSEAARLSASDPAQAEKRLKEAIGLCPQSGALRYNLAMLMYRQGRHADAKRNLDDAIRLAPGFAAAYNALAFIHLSTEGGNRDRAMDLALKAVELDPENRQYRDTLSMAKGPATASIDVDVPPATRASRPDAVAVVIGNRTYRNSTIPAVEYAINDADTVKKYLTDTLGYRKENIIYLENADKTEFQKTFGDENDHRGDLYSMVRKGSDVFIYYSGHGAPDPTTKKAYVVPSNADPNAIKFTGYALDTLYENLARINNDKQLRSLTIVLDACFSGAYNEGTIISGASPLYMDVQKPLLKIKNAVEFASSRGDQVSSWYRDKKHGLFTFFFLKAIKEAAKEGRSLTAADIEAAIGGNESVNDFAWRMYKRNQEPTVVGRKDVVIFSVK